jgi:hypothetical protein
LQFRYRGSRRESAVAQLSTLGIIRTFMKLHPIATRILLIGICLCSICALFPPRSIINTSTEQFIIVNGEQIPIKPTHDFLFDPNFGIYGDPKIGAFPAVVDGGRLLAELVLIASFTAIAILLLDKETRGPPNSNTKKDTV